MKLTQAEQPENKNDSQNTSSSDCCQNESDPNELNVLLIFLNNIIRLNRYSVNNCNKIIQ